jgi:hypothetical protein
MIIKVEVDKEKLDELKRVYEPVSKLVLSESSAFVEVKHDEILLGLNFDHVLRFVPKTNKLKSDITNLPKRDWNKTYETSWEYRGENLKIYSVKPQSHLIGVTTPTGLLEGYGPEAILVKSFEKNYKMPSRPKVVENYGLRKGHGEPIEHVLFNFENIFDRATEAQINRYRHNSKNYESGRYVNYIKHGLTIVFPDDVKTDDQKRDFIENTVVPDFERYVDVLVNGGKQQEARRRLGLYVAVESTISVNLRSLIHMAQQRSRELSPNGREAEPQISSIVTQMVEQIRPYVPTFYNTILEVIGEGYR